MTDKGPVSIRDLVPGMMIKCHDGWNELKEYPSKTPCIRMKFHGLPTTYFPTYMTTGNRVSLGDFIPSEGKELPGNRMISIMDNTGFLNIGKKYDNGFAVIYNDIDTFHSFVKNLILYTNEVPALTYGSGTVWLRFDEKIKSRELNSEDFTIRNMEHYLSGMLHRKFYPADIDKIFISDKLSESDKLILSFLKLLTSPNVHNGNRILNEKEFISHLIYEEDKSKIPQEYIPYYLKTSPDYHHEEIEAVETERCTELYPYGLWADVNGLHPTDSNYDKPKTLRWI